MLRLLLVPLVYILLVIPCQAKYTGTVEYPEFFKNLHSPDGTYCCDQSDGYPYYGNYEIKKDGSVLLEDGTLVPKGQIVPTNPTGHAIWWYTNTSYGKYTYCFSPGPLS